MGLFLKLTLIVHNLRYERPISKLMSSSSLIVLQYGVLRSTIGFSGPHFLKKRIDAKIMLFY